MRSMPKRSIPSKMGQYRTLIVVVTQLLSYLVTQLISWMVNFGVLCEIEEHHGDSFTSLYPEHLALIIAYMLNYPMGFVSVLFGYEFKSP